jgi:hypothetical protein
MVPERRSDVRHGAALAELNRIRVHDLNTGDHQIHVITRRNSLQASICAALDIDTTAWDAARVS